jgi:hypothetical protein
MSYSRFNELEALGCAQCGTDLDCCTCAAHNTCPPDEHATFSGAWLPQNRNSSNIDPALSTVHPWNTYLSDYEGTHTNFAADATDAWETYTSQVLRSNEHNPSVFDGYESSFSTISAPNAREATLLPRPQSQISGSYVPSSHTRVRPSMDVADPDGTIFFSGEEQSRAVPDFTSTGQYKCISYESPVDTTGSGYESSVQMSRMGSIEPEPTSTTSRSPRRHEKKKNGFPCHQCEKMYDRHRDLQYAPSNNIY